MAIGGAITMILDNLLLPVSYIPSNEHHGAYIEDACGNTVCDFYYMSEGTVVEHGMFADEVAKGMVDMLNHYHEMQKIELNKKIEKLEIAS